MKEKTTLTLDPRLKELGEKLAQKRRRSFSQLVEDLIEAADHGMENAAMRLSETADRIEHAASILDRFGGTAKKVSYEPKAKAKGKAKHSPNV